MPTTLYYLAAHEHINDLRKQANRSPRGTDDRRKLRIRLSLHRPAMRRRPRSATA